MWSNQWAGWNWLAALTAAFLISTAPGLAKTASADELTLGTVFPVVVRTVPQAGATDVDPALGEIRVTFSKDMRENAFAFIDLAKFPAAFPKTVGAPQLMKDRRTWVLQVKLEPGKTYALLVNPEGRQERFLDTDGMAAQCYLLAFKTAGGGNTTVDKPVNNGDDPLEAFSTRVCAVLAKLEPDPADKRAADAALRRELVSLVDKYAAALRPQEKSKTYTSRDGAFVLVIGANGANGAPGAEARANDAKARLVMAIAGDGGPAGNGQAATRGGAAFATAPEGIAVALGGRGGAGGGGGVSGNAEGKLGDVSFGGEGGKGIGGGGAGGSAGSRGIRNAEAISNAAKDLQK